MGTTKHPKNLKRKLKIPAFLVYFAGFAVTQSNQ